MIIENGKLRKPHSEETKRKISYANKQGLCGMLGKSHSEKTKLKMSVSAKNRKIK